MQLGRPLAVRKGRAVAGGEEGLRRQPSGKDELKLVAVYPPDLANGKAVLGK